MKENISDEDILKINKTPVEKYCRSGNLDDLTKHRRVSNENIKNSGNDLEKVLTEIYKRPTHFIYELIQNADDAKATEVIFKLEEDKLILWHNGTTEFGIEDVISITAIGNSTKVHDSEKVGKFGLGFKSVFAVSERPEVYSRKYNFAIEELVVPVRIPPSDLKSYTTKFVIPFKSNSIKLKDIHARISEEFENIDLPTVMFLRNLKTITLPNRELTVDRQKLERSIYKCVDNDTGSEYIVFNGQQRHSIAYQINAHSIVKPEYKYISAFLPTQEDSSVNFIIDAPFETAVTRESIDFDKSENQEILKNLRLLFQKSILGLKKLGLFTPQTITLLPIRPPEYGDNIVYKTFYDGLLESMQKEEIIPLLGSNKFAERTENIYIPCNEEIVKITEPRKWVDAGEDEELREYLQDTLNVNLYDMKQLLQEYSGHRLKDKSEQWLYDYYSYINEHYSSEPIYHQLQMREYPIIKTRTNNFRPAKEVFLRSTGVSAAKTVHTMFTTESKNVPEETRDKMNELLDHLEIRERRPSDYIKMEYLSKLKEDKTANTFKEVAKLYNESTSQDKDRIAGVLKEEKIICTQNGKHATGYSLYADTPTLRSLISRNLKRLFIDSQFWTEETKSLCIALGVKEKFSCKEHASPHYYDYSDHDRFMPSNDYLERKNIFKEKESDKMWVSRTWYIEEFADILKNIDTPEKVKALLTALPDIEGDNFKGRLSFTACNGTRPRNDGYSIDSDFIIKMDEIAWLPNTDGTKSHIYEFSKPDFIKQYHLNGDEKILDALMFKNLQGVNRQVQEYASRSLEDQKLALKLLDQYNEEKNKQNISEERIEYKAEPPLPFKEELAKRISSVQDTTTGGKIGASITRKVKTGENSRVTSNDAKVNGDINESIAMEHLKKEYCASQEEDWRELIGQNGVRIKHHGGSHKGYDIQVTKNGKIIRRIEVKSYKAGWIDISEAEWDFAKKYGDSYEIFRIKRNGKGERPEIDIVANPYKEYQDGKWELVPVALRKI